MRVKKDKSENICFNLRDKFIKQFEQPLTNLRFHEHKQIQYVALERKEEKKVMVWEYYWRAYNSL